MPRLKPFTFGLTICMTSFVATFRAAAHSASQSKACVELSTQILGDDSPIKKDSVKIATLPVVMTGGRTTQALIESLDQAAFLAKAGGADLLMLPELWALDALPVGAGQTEIFLFAKNEAHKIFEAIKTTALRHKVAVLGGSIPRAEGEKVFNTALLAFADGRVVTQDKLFLTPEEKGWSLTPGQILNVFDSSWGRAVILICYDCEIPKIAQALVASKPEIILVPSMTGAQGYRRVQIGARARSLEQHAFSVVVGAQNSRASNDADFLMGGSALFGPPSPSFRSDIERIGSQGLDFLELDLAKLRRSRLDTSVPYPARDQGD
jgi:predicted amidohydrolase